MNHFIEAIYQSWNVDRGVVAFLLLIAWTYTRGWRRLHLQSPQRFGVVRLLCFFAGLTAFFLAVASPLDAFAGLLLIVHMTQHLLLTMVAPPLILLGAPYLPLLRGLPPKVLKHGAGPFLAGPALQRFGRLVTHPAVCWIAFALTIVLWHIPLFYELALRSEFWHEVEHLSFFGSAILFWWPVIQPYPGDQRWPRWTMILYLLLADLQNTALSALLSFYERVIYPTYASVPRISELTALEDQIAAGALMWVFGSLAYLIPAGLLTIEVLSSRQGVRPSSLSFQTPVGKSRDMSHRPSLRRKAWDLLSTPLVGAVLRWRHFRRAAQAVMFLLAMIVIADGLFGHQMGSMNLAGVLPWTHWRGLVVIALLAGGNFFCMACPFMFARDLGRQIMPARWNWPRQVRSKWFAVGLLAIYLWAYEAFDLWDSPWWTAWIVIGYFVSSFVIDGLFKGASFCKYVCPIGQFNFVQSLISPLEVKVRDPDRCRTCTTYECIRGDSVQRGCELQLFQPKKEGNMDCTFCLDCVHACPHNNVGILAFVPASQLIHDRYRSSMGRFSQRPDIAALILLLVFGAFVNAAGMLKPVATWEETLRDWFNLSSLKPIEIILFVISLLVLPLFLVSLCGTLSRALGRIQVGSRDLICSFAVAFVPLGFSMWLAHLVFHLLTGGYAVVPATQRAVGDMGIGLLGKPDWSLLSALPLLDWLTSLQILFLDFGFLLTLYTGWRIAQRFQSPGTRAFRLFVPWALLAIGLYIVGVWIIFQPMQMRGMMVH
jgi:cytochrome c oxidase assembly factor CtaG